MKVSIDMKVLDSWIACISYMRTRLEDLERGMNVAKTKAERENEKSLKDLILDCCGEEEICTFCGHSRDHHDGNTGECYYNDYPSGATGCICSKFGEKKQ